MSAQPDPVTARAAARVCGDPSRLLDVATLRQFVGAPLAVAVLEDAADRAVAEGRVLEDTVILGPDGSGKQLVARALARDADQRIVELDAAWVRNAKHVARIVRSLEDRDALILRRIDELRPAQLRMLVSLMGMRTLPREADAGSPMADCTVIATAVTVPRRLSVLRRLCPLWVELPHPCAEAQTAAAYRAALALGLPGSPQLRANIADQVMFHVRAGGGGASARGATGGENAPGNLPDPVMIARVSAARGLT